MLEPRRLKRVLYDFGHFYDALLKGTTRLLTGSIPNERRLSLAIRYIFRLRGLDLTVGDLFEGSPGLLSCGLYFLF